MSLSNAIAFPLLPKWTLRLLQFLQEEKSSFHFIIQMKLKSKLWGNTPLNLFKEQPIKFSLYILSLAFKASTV